MRVLVVSAPLLGHLLPLVPLARALRDAGDDVLFASGGDALGAKVDLPVEDVVPGFSFERIARRTMLRHPLIAKAELAGEGGTRGVSLLFGAVNDQMADGVVALANRWRPDLVLFESLAVAGALAAAGLGVPAVLHENSMFDGALLVRVTTARLTAAHARQRRVTAGQPAATLTIAPPTVVGERAGWPMRCVPYSGEGQAPAWLRQDGDGRGHAQQPRILVSRSTVAGPGGGRLMSAVVDAAEGMSARGVDAEIVLVRPDARVSRRSALPNNVRTVDWVPLAAVLPTCAGIVHHGGAGTTLGALAAGVPQLVVPGPGDRRHNARLVATRGAGLAVEEKDIAAEHLARLITDAAFAMAATEVREEIAAMPAPSELVDRLHSLAPARR